jgi:hypothetical protein
MRPQTLAVILIPSVALSGCGRGAGEMRPATQHQGVMNELPGRKGYFEIRAKGDAVGGR